MLLHFRLLGLEKESCVGCYALDSELDKYIIWQKNECRFEYH